MTAPQHEAAALAVTSPSQVAKAITYIALTVAAVYVQSQGHITAPVVIAMSVAGLGAIPVYFAIGTVAKMLVGFGLAVLQGLVLTLGPTFTGGDIAHVSPYVWVGLVISGLAAIGIAIVPNKPMELVAPAQIEATTPKTEA
jgi:hypothetical protein